MSVPSALVRSQVLWNKLAFPRKSGIPLPGTPSLGASWTWSVADQGKHLCCATRWLKNGRNNGCLLVNTEHTVSARSYWKIHFTGKCEAFTDDWFVKVSKIFFFLLIHENFSFLLFFTKYIGVRLFIYFQHGLSRQIFCNANWLKFLPRVAGVVDLLMLLFFSVQTTPWGSLDKTFSGSIWWRMENPDNTAENTDC